MLDGSQVTICSTVVSQSCTLCCRVTSSMGTDELRVYQRSGLVKSIVMNIVPVVLSFIDSTGTGHWDDTWGVRHSPE